MIVKIFNVQPRTLGEDLYPHVSNRSRSLILTYPPRIWNTEVEDPSVVILESFIDFPTIRLSTTTYSMYTSGIGYLS